MGSRVIACLLMFIGIMARTGTCSGQVQHATLQDEFNTWSTPKLFEHGTSLLRHGVRLNEAIIALRMVTQRDRSDHEYPLALGCALASRFASVSCAMRQADQYERELKRFEQRHQAWTVAQNDPKNAVFGVPPPIAPAVPSTPDDTSRFALSKREGQAMLVSLRAACVLALQDAGRLTERSSTTVQADYEFYTGWALLMLWRYGENLVPLYPKVDTGSTAPVATAASEGLTDVSREAALGCFKWATALAPENASYWHSLAIAYVPQSVFASENSDPRDLSEASTSPTGNQEDRDAISALKKAIAVKPRDFDLQFLMSQLARTVDPALAVDSLARATQRMSSNATLWYLLANERFKRCKSRAVSDRLALSGQAVEDVESGNTAPLYWAIPIAIPAPPMLARAWDYLKTYGATEDHMVVQELLFALGAYLTDRDSHGDDTEFMRTVPVMMAMGLRAIGSADAADLDARHPRAKITQWARAFMGIQCCFKVFGLVQASQRTRPDVRKEAYIEGQRDLIKRLTALEEEVIKAR
jgi:tetratricopeptide (TPR) repeat protein